MTNAAPAVGVEITPAVCGGSACVAGTRIPVWSIIAYVRQGAADVTLLEDSPTLRQADLDVARLHAELG